MMDIKQHHSKKALVIFNPKAGLAVISNTEKIVKRELEDMGYVTDFFYLNRSFESKIDRYNFDNLSLVVAIGGDGTIKVAARTILTNKLNVPLAIIPFGSANMIAVALGLPLSVKGALKVIRQKSDTVKIDVGLINNHHYFLVGFSIGFISRVVTSTSGELKSRFGILGYVFRFVFNRIKLRRFKFKIQTKEEVYNIKGNSLVVFNTLNFMGFKPKNHFDLRDGILNLRVFTNRSFLASLEVIFGLMWFKEPAKHIFALDGTYFNLYVRRGLRACQIDGDYIRLPAEIEIKILPKSLAVMVKQGKSI